MPDDMNTRLHGATEVLQAASQTHADRKAPSSPGVGQSPSLPVGTLPTLRIIWLGSSSEYVARRLPDGTYVNVVNAETFYHERTTGRIAP